MLATPLVPNSSDQNKKNLNTKVLGSCYLFRGCPKICIHVHIKKIFTTHNICTPPPPKKQQQKTPQTHTRTPSQSHIRPSTLHILKGVCPNNKICTHTHTHTLPHTPRTHTHTHTYVKRRSYVHKWCSIVNTFFAIEKLTIIGGY